MKQTVTRKEVKQIHCLKSKLNPLMLRDDDEGDESKQTKIDFIKTLLGNTAQCAWW